MYSEVTPTIGHWFQTPAGARFEVVAIDDDDGTIDVQYYDGEVDEMSYDTWFDLGIIASAEPEDWSGPFDEMERDDLGFTDTNIRSITQPYNIDDFDKDS